MNKILSRKVISASISGSLFAILLGLIVPNPLETNISMESYLLDFVAATPFYLMFSYPVILIYGVLTSILSDKIGELISKNGNEKTEVIISGILHIIFGLIFLFYSLGASILFFITDKLLQKKSRNFKWVQAVKSLFIPVTLWLIFMGIVWVEHLFLLK